MAFSGWVRTPVTAAVACVVVFCLVVEPLPGAAAPSRNDGNDAGGPLDLARARLHQEERDVVLTLRRRRAGVLPAALEPAVGAALFGAAGAGSGVLAAADAVVFTTWGTGLFWTAAAGALVVAAGFTARTWHALTYTRDASVTR